MNDNVERVPAEIRFDASSHSFDAEVARFLVSLVRANVFRRGALPVLGGVRAADLNPPPTPGTVIKSVNLRLKQGGRAFVLGTVRDVFLTCGPNACAAQWGVYADNRPVPSTGMRLQAAGEASDGYSFYTLYGLTKRLKRGRHTVKLGLTSTGTPQ